MNDNLTRIAKAPDDYKVGGRYFYINTTIVSFMQKEIDIDTFRRAMYNLGIYLTLTDAEQIKYKESNHIGYSLYADTFNKHKKCMCQQELFDNFYKRKKKRLVFASVSLLLCFFISYYQLWPNFTTLLLLSNLILLLFIFFSGLYTYKVSFKRNLDEEFH